MASITWLTAPRIFRKHPESEQETNENKNVELLGRFSPCPHVWRNFPEELLVVQVETIVKNEQFADVEAVNFVKVVVNKEFDGNILTDANPTARC